MHWGAQPGYRSCDPVDPVEKKTAARRGWDIAWKATASCPDKPVPLATAGERISVDRRRTGPSVPRAQRHEGRTAGSGETVASLKAARDVACLGYRGIGCVRTRCDVGQCIEICLTGGKVSQRVDNAANALDLFQNIDVRSIRVTACTAAIRKKPSTGQPRGPTYPLCFQYLVRNHDSPCGRTAHTRTGVVVQ